MTAGRCCVGADLPRDLDLLGELLDRDGVVVARVTPEDKLRIAQALRGRGHVVAMTGDGVNDAPALREAAIGVAMGKSGTDVAREAADVVLLDDNFETIVTAVAQGRSTFANIRRFLTYHLADNVAELAPFVVWALTAGRFPLAIGVLQVLALDIGTDVFPALALGAEPPDKRALDGPPVRGHLLDRGLMLRAFAVLGLVEAVVALTAFVVSLASRRLAAGSGISQRPSVIGGVRRGVHRDRPGPGRQCVRLPKRRPPGMGDIPAHQPAADRGRRRRARSAVGVAICATRRASARTRRTIDAGFAVAATTIPAVLLADALYKRFRRPVTAEGLPALARRRVAAQAERMATKLVQVARVVALLYAARRYYRNWGTTKEECQLCLPATNWSDDPRFRQPKACGSTRHRARSGRGWCRWAKTVAGYTATRRWKTLSGCTITTPTESIRNGSRLAPGDVIRVVPKGWMGLRHGIVLSVVHVIEQQSIVLRATPPAFPWDAVWSFHIQPRWEDRCRLLVRTRTRLRRPGEVLAMELAGPVTALMTRGMLLGIKHRAEHLPATGTPLGTTSLGFACGDVEE